MIFKLKPRSKNHVGRPKRTNRALFAIIGSQITFALLLYLWNVRVRRQEPISPENDKQSHSKIVY
jgi:hypothetical protein